MKRVRLRTWLNVPVLMLIKYRKSLFPTSTFLKIVLNAERKRVKTQHFLRKLKTLEWLNQNIKEPLL